MSIKCKITRSFDIRTVEHRTSVVSCPHCGTTFELDDWGKHAAVLVLEEIWGKHGSLAVVSECPKCFEKSWCHFEFSSFDKWCDWFAPDLRAAAYTEHERRHIAAVRRYSDSLCAKCEHLKNLDCKTLPIVSCTMGDSIAKSKGGDKPFYHTCFTRTECNKFQQR